MSIPDDIDWALAVDRLLDCCADGQHVPDTTVRTRNWQRTRPRDNRDSSVG